MFVFTRVMSHSFYFSGENISVKSFHLAVGKLVDDFRKKKILSFGHRGCSVSGCCRVIGHFGKSTHGWRLTLVTPARKFTRSRSGDIYMDVIHL